ncbi:hypothetical protein VNO78_24436 [Psophocarpus tetragonolobus]|uniref:Disease resistance protein At4g27190-like leucine-rich repeats domain-containing protein n=1 Tax=Psophocarpus tetragonolobus TaxID=3891 RepID=A0AAN9XEK4_PSOTE
MNSMYFKRVDEIFSETTIKHLVQAVELLDLRRGGWRNIIPEIILPVEEGTHNIVKLSLSYFPQLECLVDNEYINYPIQNVFSKLIELNICEMDNFKELCSGSLPVQLLKSLETLLISDCKHLQGILFKRMICNLKSLTLICCPMLTSVCQFSTTQSLVFLENLYIHDCAELKYIFDVGGDHEKKSSSLVFPNLKEINIRSCPKLDFILRVIAPQDVPKLEFISIMNCIELNYIFCPHQHKHEEQDLHQDLTDAVFVMLKEVHLLNLPKLVDIFPKCDKLFKSSSMERSCSIDDSKTQTKSVPIKCNIYSWSHKHRPNQRNKRRPLDSCRDQLEDHSLPLVHHSQVNDVIGQQMIVRLVYFSNKRSMPQMPCLSIQHITTLVIRDCAKMKVVFSASNSMLRCLPQLQILHIIRCKELEQIIDEDTCMNQRTSLLPSLKLLWIQQCNNLKCVLFSTSKILPNLDFFIVEQASMLEEVFKCGSHKKVEIPNLKVVAFVGLPSLCQDVDEFHTVKDCLVLNCPKFPLTSTLTPERMEEIINGIEGTDQTNGFIKDVLHWIYDLCKKYKAQETSNQDSEAKLARSELTTSQLSKKILEGATSAEIIALPTTCSESGMDEGPKTITFVSDVNIEPATTKDVEDGHFKETLKFVTTSSQINAPGFEVTNLPNRDVVDQYEDSKAHENSNQNPNANATKDFPIETKAKATSRSELISLQLPFLREMGLLSGMGGAYVLRTKMGLGFKIKIVARDLDVEVEVEKVAIAEVQPLNDTGVDYVEGLPPKFDLLLFNTLFFYLLSECL